MKTPAVVFTGVNEAEIRDIEMPPPGPGEAQVRTLYSMVSAGTEGWAFGNRFTWQPTRYPCVPGYQRYGEVVALGAGVEGWAPGDRVMATIGRWEGAVCPFWGSHVAVANTLATELYRLPAGTSPVDASGTVVAQVGYNAASRAMVQSGAVAVVYGDGLIGQSAAQAARARGMQVVLVGHRLDRLELALRHSADHVVNARDGEVAEAVRRGVGRDTVDVVLDSVQTEASQQEYVPLLEHGRGQIVYTGFTPADTWADMGLLQKRELTTHYVSGWNRARMEAILVLMAEGRLRLEPLVTHQVPFNEGPAMYRMIREKSAPFLGIVFDWTGA